ncbi:MAG: hypothetical protein NWE98_01420 [Candidatus Bathyarchaeota archaeon]|nr:hypothetical protein [Candidatus Bathyarchaeota archaeon]
MEASVAALLLVASAVIIGCVVITYAVNVVATTIDASNVPQVDRIRDLQNNLLNQTDHIFNQTQPQLPNEPLP